MVIIIMLSWLPTHCICGRDAMSLSNFRLISSLIGHDKLSLLLLSVLFEMMTMIYNNSLPNNDSLCNYNNLLLYTN